MIPSFPIDYDVVIVGGGLTGLAAAWYLEQEMQATGRPWRYTLLEASNRWGGKIKTEQVPSPVGSSPFIVEAGPDSFITQKPWAWQLSQALGLTEQLLPTNDALRQVFVWHNGRLHPLPEGVMLIVPTKFRPFMQSSLISLPASCGWA